MRRSVKVLVIDDSALVRQTLTDIINSDSSLVVIGTAADPYFAAQKIKDLIPDVITLDIEMPRMDGLTFLRSLMAQYPIPVVIISSLTQQGSHLALRALGSGAVEIVAKSEIRNTKEYLEESRIRITDAIKAASMTTVNRVGRKSDLKHTSISRKDFSNPNPPNDQATNKVIAIGASTGGTEALRFLLSNIPADVPGIVITQHMPAGFTKSFADQLNTICAVTVKEASDGEQVLRGSAYIAPGGKHMELYRNGVHYCIRVRDGEFVNRHRPSVDVLFNSVAKHVGQNAMGIIMTGMGKDGAQGLLNMKIAGARTLAQDEASCVVFGMPKEAIRINAADQIVALHDMPKRVAPFF
jgi:two-component system chemotaxis response regulator CheB